MCFINLRCQVMVKQSHQYMSYMRVCNGETQFGFLCSDVISYSDASPRVLCTCATGPGEVYSLGQGSQTHLTWGPLEVESWSGWAASNIPQKKGAQLTQSKLMIGL